MLSDGTLGLIEDLLPALVNIFLQVAILNTPFVRRGLKKMGRDASWAATCAVMAAGWCADHAGSAAHTACTLASAAGKHAKDDAHHVAQGVAKSIAGVARAVAKGIAGVAKGIAKGHPEPRRASERLASPPRGPAPAPPAPSSSSAHRKRKPLFTPLCSPLTGTAGSPLTVTVRSLVTVPVGSPLTVPVGSPLTGNVGSPLTGNVGSILTVPVGSPLTVGSVQTRANSSPAGSPLKASFSPYATAVRQPRVQRPRDSTVRLVPSAALAHPLASTPRGSFGAGDTRGTPPRSRAAARSPPAIERFNYFQAQPQPSLSPEPAPVPEQPLTEPPVAEQLAGSPASTPRSGHRAADETAESPEAEDRPIVFPWAREQTHHPAFAKYGLSPLLLR